METVPHNPAVAPTRNDVLTLGSQIGVKIDALAGVAAGGSPILSYNVEYDHAGGGNGPFTEVAGSSSDSLLLEHTIAALTPG